MGYVDWNAAMSRLPLDFRYKSISGIAKPAEYEGTGLTADDCCEFPKARAACGQRVISKIDAGETNLNEILAKTDCPKAILSRIRKNMNAFFPVASWEALAYRIMGTSVHNFLFGCDRDLVLPKRYSLPASKMLENLSKKQISVLVSISDNFVKQYFSETVPLSGGHHRDMGTLIRERMADILEDSGKYKSNVFGDQTPTVFKANLGYFYADDKSEVKYSFICFCALNLPEITADFLVAEDPMRGYTDVFIKNENGERIKLDGENLKFWRNVMVLDEQRKKMLIEAVWTKIFESAL